MNEHIRIGTISDARLLFDWRNDELVRKNSFGQDELIYEEHYKWLERFFSDSNCRIYIIMSEGYDVGQVKVRVVDDEAEIGYSIGKEYRGHGYGTMSLKLVKEKIKEDFPSVHTIIGRVKIDNSISRRAFEKAEYETGYVQYVSKI